MQDCPHCWLPSDSQGFTLLELVLVIMLSAIISVVCTKMLATGFSAWLTGREIVSAEQQASRALERMARDIRVLRSPADIVLATASVFFFIDSSGNSIAFFRSGTSLMRNSQILSTGISALAFNYYDANGNTTAVASLIRYVMATLTVTQDSGSFSVSTVLYPGALS